MTRSALLAIGLICAAATALAQAPAQEAPKNLKVLPKDWTRAQVVAVMQNINAALGVGCDYCHVVPQGRRCVAAHSSDVAPTLIAHGAEVEIAGPSGRRRVACDEFFVGDGIHNNVLKSDELVTRVFLPDSSRGARGAYRKLRPRGAIDFPMLSVAVAARGTPEQMGPLRIVVSALGAKPRLLGSLDTLVSGKPADESTFAAVAAAASKQCRPLINVPYDDDWRHAMVPVLVTRALRDAFGMESA